MKGSPETGKFTLMQSLLITVYCARKFRDRKVYIDVVFADHSILSKEVQRQESLH